MEMLVSILIPAYNAEKWIGETIKSALGQTWPKKEVIIVDDGSRDNTLHIAKRFESKSVKVVTQQNMGACAARNKAFFLAQGSYIQWLDADDLLASDKISQQLKNNDSGLNTQVVLTSAFGTFFYRQEKAIFKPNSLWQDLAPIDWIMTKFLDCVWLNPTAWLLSRRLIESAGPWDERLSSSGDDDGEYICRIVSKSEKVKFVREAKCYYRMGNLGGLNWNTSKALDLFFIALKLSFDHLRSLEDSERTRAACLKYLQLCLPFFYPENHALLNKINDLAHELGGRLSPPELSWKYSPIKNIFGWKMAKYVMNNSRKSKLLVVKNWDRLLYHFTKSEPEV
jgi:glycosyltransferase involved in cell wall biosynthesis